MLTSVYVRSALTALFNLFTNLIIQLYLVKGRKMFDIVGMGNAIVDLTTKAAENPAFKSMHISQRGGFFRTRMDEFEEILHFSKNNEISAGGSVANSMKAFAALGGKACFSGKIGMDKYGTFFTNSLKDYHIYPGLFIDKENATGCSVIFGA